MELMEHEKKERLSREQAAQRLRDLADQLARHNEVSFVREGKTLSVKVPAEVELKLEVEVGEESEIEVEISW